MTDPSATHEPEWTLWQFQSDDGTWKCFMDEKHYCNTADSDRWLMRKLCPIDERDTLRAENAVLRDAREVLMREVRALKADVDAMQKTNDELAAENERLRFALGLAAEHLNRIYPNAEGDDFLIDTVNTTLNGDSHD